jgi:hypothetical protein
MVSNYDARFNSQKTEESLCFSEFGLWRPRPRQKFTYTDCYDRWHDGFDNNSGVLAALPSLMFLFVNEVAEWGYKHTFLAGWSKTIDTIFTPFKYLHNAVYAANYQAWNSYFGIMGESKSYCKSFFALFASTIVFAGVLVVEVAYQTAQYVSNIIYAIREDIHDFINSRNNTYNEDVNTAGLEFTRGDLGNTISQPRSAVKRLLESKKESGVQEGIVNAV